MGVKVTAVSSLCLTTETRAAGTKLSVAQLGGSEADAGRELASSLPLGLSG